MKTKYYIFLLSFFLISKSLIGQINESLYVLNPEMKNLLTEPVKNNLSSKLQDKRVVFLGESEHHIGSDFKAKFEFVKYLVEELNYKNIVFESDFFALYFEHDKRNVFYHWSNSEQCKDMFQYLKEKNITILGMDNQLHGLYSYYNLKKDFSKFLSDNKIDVDVELVNLIDKIQNFRFDLKKEINQKQKELLIEELDKLLLHPKIKENKLWYQITESIMSAAEMYYQDKTELGRAIRDKQMAKNLNFLINESENEKFIVWLANAHMSKLNEDYMENVTMGYQFNQLNPGLSYHLAITTIKTHYRKDKWLRESVKSEDNLLSLLPDIQNNYFIDANNLIKIEPKYRDLEYEGTFNIIDNEKKHYTNWFGHFDALVFIAKGERNIMIKQ